VIAAAVAAIRSGNVVGIPTDTVYGLAVDPLNEDAVQALFILKGRPEHKPVGVLAASVEQAEMIGDLGPLATELASQHWPGALTLVVRPKVILANWVGNSQSRTVGLRVPDHEIALALLTETGPLAVTSANRSDEPEALTAGEARDVFSTEVAVYLHGASPGGQASTVVAALDDELTVLRLGPVQI
jgi:L-threonylcarbamoyladenylate synthase